MKSSEYIAILQSKVVIDKEIAASLESIIEEYPFFQSARAVSLKYLHDQGSFRYNSNLKLTAAHTLDRTVLFNYITSPGFKALENIEPVWSHVYVEPVKEEEVVESALTEVVPEVIIPQDIPAQEPIEEVYDETSLHTPESVKEILIEGIDILEPEIEEELSEESIVEAVDETVIETSPEEQFIQELAETNDLNWVADVQKWTIKPEDYPVVERVEQLTPEEELELQEEQDFEHRDWFEHRTIKELVVEEEESEELVIAEDEDLVPEENFEVVSESIAQDDSVIALNPIVLEEINTPEAEEAIIEKPIQFNKNEKHSFQEWLQLTAIKPIEREEPFMAPVTTPELPDVKKKKMDLIDRFINLNPRMPKATAYDSSSQENIVSSRVENDTALMTETLAQVYLQQKKYDRAIQAYEILILKYPEKSSFFADRIKDVKILKKDNTNK